VSEPGRRGTLGAHVRPGMLFLAGALLFPAFLLQQDIAVRALQVGLFLAMSALAGKRIRPVPYLVAAAAIVLFNLLIPTGMVMIAPLGLPVTEGALKSGLVKATALTGLIALSQFSISSALRFPGRIGGLIGTSLYYFEKIMGERARIRRSDIIGSIDTLLIDIQASGAPAAADLLPGPRSSPIALLCLALIVLANWAVLALTLVHPRLLWG
jgi:hypothetical protein